MRSVDTFVAHVIAQASGRSRKERGRLGPYRLTNFLGTNHECRKDQGEGMEGADGWN